MSLFDLLFVDPPIRSIPVTKEVALRDSPPDHSPRNTHITDSRRKEVALRDSAPDHSPRNTHITNSRRRNENRHFNTIQPFSPTPTHVTGFNPLNMPVNTFLSWLDIKDRNYQVLQELSANDGFDERQGQRDFDASMSKYNLDVIRSLAEGLPPEAKKEVVTKLIANDNAMKTFNAKIRAFKEFWSGMDKWSKYWVMFVIVIALFYTLSQSTWYKQTAEGNGAVAGAYKYTAASLKDVAETANVGTSTIKNTTKTAALGVNGVLDCMKTLCFVPWVHQFETTIGAGPFENEDVQNEESSKLFDELLIVVGNLHIDEDTLNMIMEMREMY